VADSPISLLPQDLRWHPGSLEHCDPPWFRMHTVGGMIPRLRRTAGTLVVEEGLLDVRLAGCLI